ncbi:NucA/NucB deoxyribonuclease domain-containing protein [Acinetobacter wuhouensis]|uniref:Deoxyribonuclease NucA/NucB domain-containing protein n=1 Tax=Acinetobacter wuhouensis TaxID=1879050 RepID=A0A3G2T271_9GAMM|nr:NucA/NucB deoxyribonuclease domain-containing protein [Acinetobacter wuhouensis]AYO54072.1 hypothetical protein CDG68_10695 [Acinetobacter wuhouensis]
MKKIIYLISILFYFLLNNITHAYDPEPPEQNSSEKIKPEIFLGTLNTIVMTANALESGADSAPDVSPACEKVGDGAYNSLNSRTSFCQKFSTELEVQDAEGFFVNTAYVTGYIYTEEDNPINTTDWPVKFKFRTVYKNPTGPLAHIAPRLECGTAENSELECEQIGGMPEVTLYPGLSSEVQVITRMNLGKMPFTAGHPITDEKIYTSDKFYYKFSGLRINANFNIVGQPITKDYFYQNLDLIPELRCDKNLAKGNTTGCVFYQAPAILKTIKGTDPDSLVRQSVEHIRDAQNIGLPGKFIPQADSIFPDSSAKPLRRLRDVAQINKNRRFSTAICKAGDATYSDDCQQPEGSEDEVKGCQCDEYPFASTYEGGGNNDSDQKVSVRMITGGDNSSAGGRLGAFYSNQRVIDGESFYINID